MLPANNLFLDDSIEKRLSIVSDDQTINITNEDIHSEEFTLKESIISDNSLKFGSCESNSIQFTIANNFPSTVGKWLTVVITPYNRNGTAGTAMTLGRFKVFSDKPSGDRQTRTILAYDKLFYVCRKNYKRWYRRVAFSENSTLTIKQFRDAFFTKIGITQQSVTLVNDSVSIKKVKVPSKLTGKDILTAICEFNGVFGHIGRDNTFNYITLNSATSPTDISKTYTIKVEYEDASIAAIDRLEIMGKSGDIVASVGASEDNSTNKYTLDNNFIVNGMNSVNYSSAATTLKNQMAKCSFIPVMADMKGHPRYEVGDRITYNVGNTTKTSFILSRTMEGIQSLHDNYESNIDEYYSNEPYAVNTKTSQMKSMEYQIGELEGMTECHLEKLDDGTIVIRDENLAGDEENGSWNTKLFWMWTQNDLIVDYQHTWAIYDDRIKCNYPFLVVDFPFNMYSTPRIADINGTNYYESLICLVVRTPKDAPTPTWKELKTYHDGNREQSRQISVSFLDGTTWGTENTQQKASNKIIVGDYAYYYIGHGVGSPYSGLYGMCRPDKHYPSQEAFLAAYQAGEINPPDTRNGDIILPTGTTQKETTDAIQGLANAISGASGSGYDPTTEMQVNPDSTTDVISENNAKTVAGAINQIKEGIKNWVGSVVDKGRGDIIATVVTREGAEGTNIHASTNLVTVGTEPMTPGFGEPKDLHCVIADPSGLGVEQSYIRDWTLSFLRATQNGYWISLNGQLTEGVVNYSGKEILKIDGLTSGQQYTFTYKVRGLVWSESGGYESIEYLTVEGQRTGKYGVLFHDATTIDESTIPGVGNGNYWDATIQWQNFPDIQSTEISFTNVVTATASTMYAHFYLEPIKKYEDKVVIYSIIDFKTAEMDLSFCRFFVKGEDDVWYEFNKGEGTVNYEVLEQKPQVNGNTLIGNKTTRDLGIMQKLHLADFNQLSTAEQDNPDKFYFVDDKEGSGGGGGGGSSTLSGLTDVSLSSLTDGQVLEYDSANSVWKNANPSGGTTVVANPSGAATDTLNKLQVGSTVYDVGGGASYSTSERVVGTWIDGKPLYQITQVYDKTTINTSTKQFAHNVANIDQICGMECLYSFSGYLPDEKYMAILPWCYNENNSSSNLYYGGYRIGKDKIFVQIGNSLYAATSEWAFTFKYTKTTDTANN